MSALDEVLEVGVDDYWAENSSDVLKKAHIELAALRAELESANGRLAWMRKALCVYAKRSNWRSDSSDYLGMTLNVLSIKNGGDDGWDIAVAALKED